MLGLRGRQKFYTAHLVHRLCHFLDVGPVQIGREKKKRIREKVGGIFRYFKCTSVELLESGVAKCLDIKLIMIVRLSQLQLRCFLDVK